MLPSPPQNEDENPIVDDPFFNTAVNNPVLFTNETLLWQERQRRQRTLRLLMMFLMLLLLMDGDEPRSSEHLRNRHRIKKNSVPLPKLIVSDEKVYHYRRKLDEAISNLVIASEEKSNEDLIEEYPRNITGYYRGEWHRCDPFEDVSSWRSSEDLIGISLLPSNKNIKLLDEDSNSSLDSSLEIIESEYLDKKLIINKTSSVEKKSPATVTQSNGRVAFQMYMKSIPGMSELSLIDGFVKLYDGTGVSSTRRDMLLRASGVFVHSLGFLSLIANAGKDRSVLYIENQNSTQKRSLKNNVTLDLENNLKELLKASEKDESKEETLAILNSLHTKTLELYSPEEDSSGWKSFISSPRILEDFKDVNVLPFPYIPDDPENSEKNYLGTSRMLPLREQALLQNGASCETLIKLKVSPLLVKKKDQAQLEKYRQYKITESAPKSNKISPIATNNFPKDPKEYLVMSFEGNLHSPYCQFNVNVTATAIRIDWESTTGKAINYSFYMMLTCLAQIVVLLRQLLHTQAQSAASRVSLLCIGWQTLLDAMLCIGHVLLCLMMQPLFTAFASVAFFKLLIFCVIEMKYMAIILQARQNSAQNLGNHQTMTERLRQQVTKLHVRFYTALFLSLMIFWYMGRTYLPYLILLLYSFWVPQILYNIITEAKRPLHMHYIYGMSITRTVFPLYMFGYTHNFFKEANPEFHVNTYICYLLVAWIMTQTAILIAQGKYGARFMIPARFLPPKFDYSRPIPHALLLQSTSSTNLEDLPSNNTNSSTTRNRLNGTSNNTADTSLTTCTTLDCVICYNPIDVHNRREYMLAPCDHVFHRECLEQWMDVKMECPICRMDLPPI